MAKQPDDFRSWTKPSLRKQPTSAREWAELIASQFETDAVDAIEEGVVRGLAMQAASSPSPDEDAVERARELARLFPTACDVLTRQEMRDAKGNLRSLIDQQTAALRKLSAALSALANQSEPIVGDDPKADARRDFDEVFDKHAPAIKAAIEPVVGPAATVDDLKARLVATRNVNIPAIDGQWDNSPRFEPVNPDGPAALARIEVLERDNRRAWRLLEQVRDTLPGITPELMSQIHALKGVGTDEQTATSNG